MLSFCSYQFDKELTETWNAAANAGYFAYKLDKVEGRLTPGKYSLYVQVISVIFSLVQV